MWPAKVLRHYKSHLVVLGRSALALSLALHPLAEAFVLTVDRDQNLRGETRLGNGSSDLRIIGQVKAGQKVEIPDEVLPESLRPHYYRGDAQTREVAILYWLKSGFEKSPWAESYRRNYRSENQKRLAEDYFLPVEVLDPQGRRTGQKGMLSLSHLVAKKQQLLVERGGPLYGTRPVTSPRVSTTDTSKPSSTPAPSPAPSVERISAEESTEAGLPVTCDESCRSGSSGLSGLASFSRELQKYFLAADSPVQEQLKTVDERQKTMRKKSGSAPAVRRNFERTCAMPWSQFENAVKKEAAQQCVPIDVIWTVMHKESSGNCRAFNPQDSARGSVGLFQINGGKSTDPIVNMQSGVRIMAEKYRSVNGGGPASCKSWTAQGTKGRDKWRKAIAAYNAGQLHGIHADRAIQEFNRRYLASSAFKLDPSNWEHQRLFLLRFFLAREDQEFLFGNQLGKERRRMAITNIANVEAMLGRENDSSGNSIIDRWIGSGGDSI